MAENKYSLWIVPGGKAGEQLQSLVQELAIKHDAPVFVSHLTVVGNIYASEQELELEKQKTKQLAKNLGQFTIRLTKYGYLDEEFRSLYLLVEAENLSRVYEEAALFFPQVADEHFAAMPHMSVLYGNYPESLKQEIIANNPIAPIEFTVSSVDFYLTNGSPRGWKLENRFEFS